jgi:DNA-binding Lrp family transcriptional regulator
MSSLFDELDDHSKQPRSNHRSHLQKLLSTFRASTRKTYLQILQMAGRAEGVTTNEISEQLGIKPQSVHPLLKRLEIRAALHREKRDSSLNSRGFVSQEYFYHLDSNIPLREVEEALNAIANDQFDLEQKSAGDDQTEDLEQSDKPELTATESFQDILKSDRYITETMNQSTTGWQEKLIQLRLSKLPEFNPEWSAAAQKAWFDALDRASSVSDLETKG